MKARSKCDIETERRRENWPFDRQKRSAVCVRVLTICRDRTTAELHARHFPMQVGLAVESKWCLAGMPVQQTFRIRPTDRIERGRRCSSVPAEICIAPEQLARDAISH